MPNAKIIEAELRGLRSEREQIVKWLRHEYRMNASAVSFADAIARGEHEHAIVEHRPTCHDVACEGCACKSDATVAWFAAYVAIGNWAAQCDLAHFTRRAEAAAARIRPLTDAAWDALGEGPEVSGGALTACGCVCWMCLAADRGRGAHAQCEYGCKLVRREHDL